MASPYYHWSRQKDQKGKEDLACLRLYKTCEHGVHVIRCYKIKSQSRYGLPLAIASGIKPLLRYSSSCLNAHSVFLQKIVRHQNMSAVPETCVTLDHVLRSSENGVTHNHGLLV